MRRIAGLLLIVVLTIAASIADGYRGNLWQSYSNVKSPYLADLPSGATRPALARRVVVVLVRALRLDESQRIAALNDLRKRGTDLVVQHDAPTYRAPTWVTLFSGAPSQVHGVTTNFSARAAGVSNIFRELQLAGEATAIVGSQAMGDQFGDDVQRFEVVENQDVAQRDDDAIALALEVLKDTANPVRLLCIELTAVEQWSLVDAVNVDPALSVTNARLQTLFGVLDPTTTAVVVMSDRGLTSRGSDGGAEPAVAQTPLVMAGTGIAEGEQAIIQNIDVAPTLAALTGAPLPAQALGQPALQALTLLASGALPASADITASLTTTETLNPLPALLWSSATQLTTFYENWSEVVRQPRFAAELLRAHQTDIRAGDSAAYKDFVAQLRSRASTGLSARLDSERAERLPIAIGGALFLLAVLGATLSARRWQPIFGAALYAAVWYALFTIVRSYTPSLSMFFNSDPNGFLSAISRDSAVLMAGVCVVVALTTGRHEDALEAIATVVNTLLLIVCIQAAQVIWFYFQWGIQYTYYLPDSAALVSALVALTQAAALSIRITPELPNLPLPLAVGFITLIVYSLVRHRDRPTHYGRFR